MRGAVLSVLVLIATAAMAQVRETITVEVVDVPVYVVGPDGKAVRGLTKDAFTLLIDGKPRPIEYFDTVDFGAVRSPASTPQSQPQTQRQRRLYLLLFDLTFKQTQVVAKLVRAQKAAEKAIEASNPATDLFAVATYSTNRGVQFATPFLSDRVAIRRALYTLHQSKAQDALGLEITEDERAIWDSLAADPNVSAETLEAVRGGQANQEMATAENARRIESQFDSLSEVAARLAGLEGQKHVLLFTEGFEAGLVHDINRRFGGPPQTDARLMRILDEMYRRFQSAGVILDSIDIAGVRHTFNNLDNDALFVLARGTGGQVVRNKNDLTAAITDLTTSQQIVYLLGFRRRDDRQHRIDVRVSGAPRGSNLFYRTGFGAPSKPGADALQLADVILNDVPQGGFTLHLEVTPAAGSAQLLVSFPRAEVVPQLIDGSPYVDALLYVFNERGESVAFRAKRIAFETRQIDGSVAFNQTFEIPAGKYVAKVLLRIAGTNALAYARREFVVP